jgi:hypothetical protein
MVGRTFVRRRIVSKPGAGGKGMFRHSRNLIALLQTGLDACLWTVQLPTSCDSASVMPFL